MRCAMDDEAPTRHRAAHEDEGRKIPIFTRYAELHWTDRELEGHAQWLRDLIATDPDPANTRSRQYNLARTEEILAARRASDAKEGRTPPPRG